MLWGLPEPLQVLVIPQGFSQGLGTLVTHFVTPEPEKTNKNHTLLESFSVDGELLVVTEPLMCP